MPTSSSQTYRKLVGYLRGPMAVDVSTTNTRTMMTDQASSEDWRNRARCLDRDPEMFFPQERDYSIAYRAAKLVCKSCPVVTQCLQFAIDNQCEGIWGGTTSNERRTKFGQLRSQNIRHLGHTMSEVIPGRCLTCDRRRGKKARGTYSQWSA